MRVTVRGMGVKLPDFLIVGAAKSGTTSLYYYLKQHPQIFMPRQKELRYFCLAHIPPIESRKSKLLGPVWSLDGYISHFREAWDSQIMGEACPGYLYAYEDTIRNI